MKFENSNGMTQNLVLNFQYSLCHSDDKSADGGFDFDYSVFLDAQVYNETIKTEVRATAVIRIYMPTPFADCSLSLNVL